MNTNKQSEATQPITSFGTAPEANPSLKQTNYAGLRLKERYLIEGELGRGGIGVVYLAQDTQLLQRRVVIKVLLESTENSLHTPWFRKKFDQEIEALVRIDHPGVVGVLDAGTMPDGKPFFVMQYVEGITLRELMQQEWRQGKLDFVRIANIVRLVGQALTAAHEKGIIHRDLKPENVMVQTPQEGEEIVKLIDFGIATVKDSKLTDTDGGKTKVAGALPYMAPEQLRGEPQAASDIWSLGVMAYELLTGQMPFQADTLIKLHEQQQGGVFAAPRQLRHDLSPSAERALLKALAYLPSDRYPRARDFGDALSEALLAGIPRAVQTNSGHDHGHDFTTSVSPSAVTQLAGVVNRPGVIDLEESTTLPTQKASPLPYVLAALIVLAIATGIYLYRQTTMPNRGGTPSPTVVPTPARQLDYSLTARLKKNPSGNQTELAGEIVFTVGDALRFNFSSPQDGFLYIISEAPKPNPKTGLPFYNLLFPAPAITDAPTVKARQKIFIPAENSFYPIDDEEGTEKLWLVWSERPVSEMEQVRKWHNPTDGGEIKDDGEIKLVQEFLQRGARPTATKEEEHVSLKGGQNGLLVYPIRLEHFKGR